MRLALVALVACSTSPPPAAPPAPRDAAVDAIAIDGPGFTLLGPYVPVIRTPARPQPVVAQTPQRAASEAKPAIHGGQIELLAVTEDGKAAVTVDHLGGARLWPTLDGTLEPVVIALGHPAQIAVARSNDGFAIAALDRAGALAIVSVRGTGAIVGRAPIDEARPFVAVVAIGDGFVATTDDQRLGLTALDGSLRYRLTPEPGEHVVGIVHGGTATLALIAKGEVIHGRWITVGGWADDTPRLRIDPTHVALSPDGTRLAARRAGEAAVAIFETATGREVSTISDNGDDIIPLIPLGYLDPHQLAVTDGFGLGIANDAAFGGFTFGDDRRAARIVATGRGVAVIARGASLALVTSTGVKLLGYRLAMASQLRILDHGALLGDGQTIVRVDDRFAERERYPLPPNIWNVTLVDAHRALAVATEGQVVDLVALDLDDRDAMTILVHGITGEVTYQPATRLYAIIAGGGLAVGRYDPHTTSFTAPIQIPLEGTSPRFALPAHGAPVVIADVRVDTIATTVVRSLDFAAGTFTAAPVRIAKLDPDFWGHGLEEADLAQPLRVTHGALVATVGFGRITLRDGATLRWVVPSHGIAQLAWTARGELLVGLGNGLARLDLATGALEGQHCGWGFGLSDETAEQFASSQPTVCDAE